MTHDHATILDMILKVLQTLKKPLRLLSEQGELTRQTGNTSSRDLPALMEVEQGEGGQVPQCSHTKVGQLIATLQVQFLKLLACAQSPQFPTCKAPAMVLRCYLHLPSRLQKGCDSGMGGPFSAPTSAKDRHFKATVK